MIANLVSLFLRKIFNHPIPFSIFLNYLPLEIYMVLEYSSSKDALWRDWFDIGPVILKLICKLLMIPD